MVEILLVNLIGVLVRSISIDAEALTQGFILVASSFSAPEKDNPLVSHLRNRLHLGMRKCFLEGC